MPKPLAGQTTTRQERLSRYRMIERALPIAAQHAAAGHLDRRIEAALAAGGCGPAFANRAELAAAAQTQWWQRLLSRLDAMLDADVAGIPGAVVTAAIQQAWDATVSELPGYLALAATAAGEPNVRRGTLRYARLLALFAGLATVDDEPVGAARTGITLIEQVSSASAGPPSAEATAGAGSPVTGGRALSLSH
ncbi:MAG: hypothetical protein M3083_11525 [Actinomycetota bacterium]|nr:hypothetical protein [Actinomycetota bacterium]MDQ6949390.1 hypothetical protein [Actinomycetota bacterium]